MVSQALARLLEMEGDPLGLCLRVGNLENPCERVVGVVEDVPQAAHDAPDLQVFRKALAGESMRRALLVTVVPEAGPGIGGRLGGTLRAVFPLAPAPFSVRDSFLSIFEYQRNGYRFLATISVLALLLAGAGFFGLYSLKLARSTEEVALRYALGASPGKLAGEVVVGAIVRLIPPLVIVSLFLSAGASALRPLLPGTTLLDPGILMLTLLLLLGVALSAVAAPVRSTLLVDPAQTLKADS